MELDHTAMNARILQVTILQYSVNYHLVYCFSVDTTVKGLSIISSTSNSIILIWDPIISVSDVTYEYELAYSTECSSNHTTLPEGYTLYYPRTSNHYIEVVGLMSATCYVFGVRVYTSVTDYPGEFSVIEGNTISEDGL